MPARTSTWTLVRASCRLGLGWEPHLSQDVSGHGGRSEERDAPGGGGDTR